VLATIEIIGNETTALSTHVLPTKDQLERADITLWDTLTPRVAVQHTPAVVDPVGDTNSLRQLVRLCAGFHRNAPCGPATSAHAPAAG